MTRMTAFEYVCQEVQRDTGMTDAVARGTVRLAVKEAGLDPDAVGSGQMVVVVEKLLPQELASHRIEGAAELCSRLAQGLGCHDFAAASDRAGAAAGILSRLGG